MKRTDPPIIVTHNYPVTKETLWTLITETAHMQQWFFEAMPSFQAEVGFKTEFPVHSEDRIFTHQWTVTAVEPKKSIAYEWRYPEYPGASVLTFQLEENNGNTTLSAICDIMEDFPDDVPEFKRESCIGGWNYFLKQRLKEYIEQNQF